MGVYQHKHTVVMHNRADEEDIVVKCQRQTLLRR